VYTGSVERGFSGAAEAFGIPFDLLDDYAQHVCEKLG
jgi:hypothetical protein